MKELVGKTISRILVNSAQDVLVFETDSGPIAYAGYGDCCSETWFADITGVDALRGATIRSAEEVEMESVNDGRTFYGIKLITSKGQADIVYRNSSNGYYGGECLLLDKPPNTTGWVEIFDDWTA